MKTFLDILKGALTALGLVKIVVPSAPSIPLPKKGPKVDKLD